MDGEYLFETFSADVGDFDQEFTNYLNGKKGQNWKVKNCTFCHDTDNRKTFASCLFKGDD
ncbi:MAG: hypothetical protein ACLGPL_12615 [Acidobacteriota bacterium]